MSIREVIQFLEILFKSVLEMFGISFGGEEAEGTEGSDEPAIF